jgi:hypothetical protein
MRGHDSQRKREKEALQRAERLIERQRAQRASKARKDDMTNTSANENPEQPESNDPPRHQLMSTTLAVAMASKRADPLRERRGGLLLRAPFLEAD